MNETTEISSSLKEEKLKNTSAMSSYDVLEHAAVSFANQTALIALADEKLLDTPQTVTYAELLQRVNQTANLIHALGIKPNQVVSYLLPNIFENYFILFGAQTAAIANPIAPMLPPPQIAALFADAGTELIITAGSAINPFWENILIARELYEKDSNKKIRMLAIHGETNTIERILNFHDALKEQPTNELLFDKPTNSHVVCLYMHSSGTTSNPKLAAFTHRNILSMALATGECFNYQSDSVFLNGMPLFHVAAPMLGGITAFRAGAQVVLMGTVGWMNPLVVKNFWKIIEKYKGTHTAALPFVYYQLNDVAVDANIRSMRCLISGSALSPEGLRQFESNTELDITVIHGLTESTGITSFNLPNNRRPGAMGKPARDMELRIIKLDKQGNIARDNQNHCIECKTGEPGLLFMRGPAVVTGYKQKGTTQLDQSAIVEGWFNTGDIAKKDAQGFYWMVCRRQELIFCNGELLSALEIETLFMNHSTIEMVAVKAQKDAKKGEVPCAFIQLKVGKKLVDSDWQLWMQQTFKAHPTWRPEHIIFIKEMPRNGMGKILKYLLSTSISSI